MFKVFFLMSGAGAGAETGPSIFQSFIFIFLIFAIFYFLMIRPQQKKQKEAPLRYKLAWSDFSDYVWYYTRAVKENR